VGAHSVWTSNAKSSKDEPGPKSRSRSQPILDGSGWLLGALFAAESAGGASIISWVLAAFMLIVLALIHAELGTAYPVAGGTSRFPYFSFGALAGFTAGWAAYLQAVTIAPIEVEASISYLDGTDWTKQHFSMLNSNGTLNGRGLIIAAAAMLVFTIINVMGAKLLSDSNSVIVLWKIAVPALTVVVLVILTFHISNFTAGGGFAPYGAHGIFAALPAGVVFALQGFEQAVQNGRRGQGSPADHATCRDHRHVDPGPRCTSASRWRSSGDSTRPTSPTGGSTRSARGPSTPPSTRSRLRSAPAGSRRSFSSTRSSPLPVPD
jgi:hypothetical protein